MRLACLLTAALVLTLAAPAAAKFPQHVDATVQPNGTVSETSSTVPKAADSAKITVDPDADDERAFFNDMFSTVASTKKARVLACVGLFAIFEDLEDDEE